MPDWKVKEVPIEDFTCRDMIRMFSTALLESFYVYQSTEESKNFMVQRSYVMWIFYSVFKVLILTKLIT